MTTDEIIEILQKYLHIGYQEESVENVTEGEDSFIPIVRTSVGQLVMKGVDQAAQAIAEKFAEKEKELEKIRQTALQGIEEEDRLDKLCKQIGLDRDHWRQRAEQAEAAEGKWVSVNERLPEEKGVYWVFVQRDEDDYLMAEAYYYGSATGARFMNSVLGIEHSDVSHWQPLPPPPAEKGEQQV